MSFEQISHILDAADSLIIYHNSERDRQKHFKHP